MSDSSKLRGFTTAILHSDRDQVIEHGALHKPLHLSVAYGYRDARELAAVFQGRAPGYAYGRQGNPTSAALEAKINAMEGGIATVSFATGMAAIGAVLLALLKVGDHIIASHYVFGNTASQLATLEMHGHAVTFVDATDARQVEAALLPATRVVFVETIANPRTQVADLARIGELCRARGILYIVDNTMTSPWLFQPRDVGASLIVNALTKYIGGHGNALAGSITDTGLFDWAAFPNIADSYKAQPPRMWGITQLRKKGLRDWGGTLSPEQAHHIAAGAETLALRMQQICANAQALAELLQQHPRVGAVYYPGLPSHPQHDLARRLFRGYFGGLLAFELDADMDMFDCLNRLKIAVLSSNLGDNRTLAIPVAHTIFYEMGAHRRAAMGIAESLVRVSVGIEDRDDLLDDFRQALA
ncbi:MAG: cystathionine gamma-synthase family protein [Betaproteobacteria bacterium]|nr:cystathionine gamma-synthase family protein [Betaproteobacteria bacterium]